MVRKLTAVLFVALALVAFTSLASANETIIKAGESSVCENASWIAYNTSESKDTTLVFNVGPIAYGWGKDESVSIPAGGYEANALARKTTFTNKGPGSIMVNCQRQRFDRHDWKIDPGSGKTYQSNYHLDHVQPDTYIEPGLGQPLGTERGIGAVLGHRSESNR
ncbi:hypothetical protein GWO43_07475 [candidate division KSB1 bacterium]|nr:hypothetical protein [candidate division KSB1 bacterium]NIW68822.1 hypothetical protein [candidate division KSB1 bacterium]NIX70407.1 hypothetical protein [candidate division KSB1 bacterium]